MILMKFLIKKFDGLKYSTSKEFETLIYSIAINMKLRIGNAHSCHLKLARAIFDLHEKSSQIKSIYFSYLKLYRLKVKMNHQMKNALIFIFNNLNAMRDNYWDHIYALQIFILL